MGTLLVSMTKVISDGAGATYTVGDALISSAIGLLDSFAPPETNLEVEEGDLSDITALLPTSEQMDTAVRSGCICAEATEWMPLAMAMAGEEIPVDGAPNPPPIADGGEPPMVGGANTYLVLVQYIETEFGCSCTEARPRHRSLYV